MRTKFLNFILENCQDQHFHEIVEDYFKKYQKDFLRNMRITLCQFAPRKDKDDVYYVSAKVNFPITPTKTKLISLSVGRLDQYKSITDDRLYLNARKKMLKYFDERFGVTP